MHDVVIVAFRRWFVAAAMRAILDPPSVGARSIIARATALDNMRRSFASPWVCARLGVTSLGSLFVILDNRRQTRARDPRVETDVERAKGA